MKRFLHGNDDVPIKMFVCNWLSLISARVIVLFYV